MSTSPSLAPNHPQSGSFLPNYLKRRRSAISAEPTPLVGSAKDIPSYPKTVETSDRIKQCILKNILFKRLDPKQLSVVTNAMFEVKVKAGDIVIKQGSEGDNFYVVEDGELEIYVSQNPDNKTHEEPNQKLVAVSKRGSYFGELALMYNSTRAATVKAVTDCILFALDRVTFRTILFDTTNKKRNLYKSFLEAIPLLAPLDTYEKFKVADAFESVEYEQGDYIVRQGEAGDAFYIIEEGEGTIFFTPKEGAERIELKKVAPGDYFGELSLLTSKPRFANVVAKVKTRVVKLDRDAFVRLLGPCEDLLLKNAQLYGVRIYNSFLDEVHLFASLTKPEKFKIANALKPIYFKDGETIIHQGEEGDVFYIVEQGTATVTKKNRDGEVVEVLRLGKGDYFGELALLHQSKRRATVTAVGPVKCVTLQRDDFANLLGHSCEDMLQRNQDHYRMIDELRKTDL